jgi:hypothetical protein
MESTVLILTKVPSADVAEKICLFLGDDPPIFEDEVEARWRPMFRALEDLFPPDELMSIGNEYLLFNWMCNDWEEACREYSRALGKAGQVDRAIYYCDDEDEGYLLVDKKRFQPVKPPSDRSPDNRLAKVLPDWGDESDRVVISNLMYMLDCVTGSA